MPDKLQHEYSSMMDGAEGNSNVSESSSAPQAAPETSPPANPYAGTKHRVKIDGREEEIEYERMVADYQTRRSSDAKFKSAKELERQARAAFEAMRAGDLTLLKKLGVPKDALRKFSEEQLLEFIEEEQMDPRDRKARDAETRAERAERLLKEREAEDEERQLRATDEEQARELEQELMDAVKELGHEIKVTPRLVRRIAEQMQASLLASQNDPDRRPMPAKIAAQIAKKGLKQDFREYLELATAEEIIAMLPQSKRDAIRQADVESVVSQMPGGMRRTAQSEALPPRAKKRASFEDYFAHKEKVFNK